MRPFPTPRDVEIYITGKCNLRCAYCSHFTGAADVNRDLPAKEWLKLFEELGRNSVMRVILEGGEPLIRDDIKEIIDGIVKNRMRFTILTNGTLVDDDIASYIHSTGRCDMIQVSLDGDTGESHEVFRGRGTFKRAIRGIRNLQLYRLPVSVRMTIHRHNYLQLPAVARLLLEDMGLPSFSTNSAAYLGNCRQESDRIQLNVAERVVTMESLIELNKKYGGRITGQAGPIADASMWNEMLSARSKGLPSLPGKGYLNGCNGVFQKIAVRSDGAYTPCVHLSHLVLGYINADPLKEVWDNSPILQGLRERGRIPLDRFEPCNACEYRTYCTGNCPALSYTRYGEENMPNYDSCLKKFLGEGGRVPHEDPIKAGNNGGC